MVQIAGVADLLRHLHQLSKRFGDGVGGAVGDGDPQRQRQQRAEQRDHDGRVGGGFVGLAPLLEDLLFSWSATSRKSVAFFTHEEASFCR